MTRGPCPARSAGTGYRMRRPGMLRRESEVPGSESFIDALSPMLSLGPIRGVPGVLPDWCREFVSS